MAFPASPSNNQVHKEGDKTFVYDTALGGGSVGVWDQVKEANSQETGSISNTTLGSGVAFPSGHVIQIVSHTDTSERSNANPAGTALEAVRKLITSTVANSKFYMTSTLSISVADSHMGWGLFLNGLATASNLIFTASHSDTTASGNGWHGSYQAAGGVTYLNPSISFLYTPSSHSVGTDFTFYTGGMGYAGSRLTMVNRNSNSHSGRSTITIFEVMP